MASQAPPDTAADVQESLIEYPCNFPIKAMGKNENGFEAMATNIILKHAEIYPGEDIKSNPSGSGNFISITVPIRALSKAQLDSIYQDLTDCEQVLVAL